MKSFQNHSLLISFVIIISLSSCFISCKKRSTDIYEEKNKDLKVADELLDQIDLIYTQNADSAISFIFTHIHSDSIINSPLVYYNIVEKLAILKSYYGEIDSSLHYFIIANNYWEKDTSTVGKKHYCSTLFNIAYSYYQRGEHKKAIDLFNKVIFYSEKINYYQSAVNANILLSNIYESEGEYRKALECIEKSIYLCHQQKDSVSIIMALQSYANLYTNCGLYDEAEQQFNDVLNYQEHSSPYSKFCYFNGKGRMYYLQGDYVNAKSQFQKALEQADKNDGYSCMIALLNLAETSLLLNDLDSSITHLKLVEQFKDGLNNMPLFKFNYNSLLGEYQLKKGQYILAGTALKIADSIVNNADIDKVVLKLHQKRKIKLYAATNNFFNAYTQLEEYDKLNNLILDENNCKQVAGLKYKFQRDTTIISQRNNIVINEQQIKTYKYQQWLYIISIVVLLVLVGLIIIFFRKVRALNHEKNIRKIAALKMESIRGRISPHFAFNVLNNIWAIIDDKENAKVQFDNLMNMIRHSLINTEKMSIPLSEEIEFVKCFINLQNLRMNNDLDVEWNIEQFVNLQQHVPGMILQIPVENAIKHGLSPKMGAKKLRIDISNTAGFLNLVIFDNGVGYQPSSIATQGTGTGLKVLTNTLHLLNQINTLKMSYEMVNLSSEGSTGTRVVIKIPLNYNYNLN
jgi:tetratricopeptide (TPR) repeat protein/two-component sensor histidine kinase